MSMTIQEWQRIAKQLAGQVVKLDGSDAERALLEHIDNVPTLRDEVLWLVNNWLSKAKRPEARLPGTLRVDSPVPCNTLKFTDVQADVLRIVIGRLFDGTLTLNPVTGAMSPVTDRCDHAVALSPDAIAQPQRGSRPWR